MKPASHYADRAWAILLEDDRESMERLFAEAQADALRHAADTFRCGAHGSAAFYAWLSTVESLEIQADRLWTTVIDALNP